MQTLAEYNAAAEAMRQKAKDMKLERWEKFIGLACDECGHELVGEKSLLMSSPPQQNIRCPHCNWTGRRFVY